MYFIHFSNYKYGKGHQNNPQTPRILPRRDNAPGFEIPGSAPVEDLKAREFRKMPNSYMHWNSVSMGVLVGVVSTDPPSPSPSP